MNQEKLFKEAAAQHSIYQKDLKAGYKALLATILAALTRGEEVKLKGVGKFIPVDRKPHSCRDPRTGKQIVSQDRKTVVFKPSKSVKLK